MVLISDGAGGSSGGLLLPPLLLVLSAAMEMSARLVIFILSNLQSQYYQY